MENFDVNLETIKKIVTNLKHLTISKTITWRHENGWFIAIIDNKECAVSQSYLSIDNILMQSLSIGNPMEAPDHTDSARKEDFIMSLYMILLNNYIEEFLDVTDTMVNQSLLGVNV